MTPVCLVHSRQHTRSTHLFLVIGSCEASSFCSCQKRTTASSAAVTALHAHTRTCLPCNWKGAPFEPSPTRPPRSRALAAHPLLSVAVSSGVCLFHFVLFIRFHV